MEQYFAKQLGNCCKLNFFNNAIKSQRPLLSPKNPSQKPLKVILKTQKKSLKKVHSDHVITLTKQSTKQTVFDLKKKHDIQKQQMEFDDYGNAIFRNPKAEIKSEIPKKKVFSAENNQSKYSTSLQRDQILVDANKKSFVDQQRNNRFSHQPQLIKYLPNGHVPPQVVYQNQNKIGSFNNLVKPMPQPKLIPRSPEPTRIINHLSPYPGDYYYVPQRQTFPLVPEIKQQIQKKSIHINKVTSQNQYFDAKTPTAKKNVMPYSQSFKQLYGQVELEDEIKKDLMKSIEVNKIQTPSEMTLNGVSVFTKTACSEQSTIVATELKSTKKGDWHDSFHFEGKLHTQKLLKVDSLHNERETLKIIHRERPKFKSIVSVESEHGSSQAMDSIILEQLPHELVSSKPIKSLL